MKIVLGSGRVARALALAIAGLLVAHTIAQYFAAQTETGYFYGIGELFDVDQETNLPTFYSSLALLLAAAGRARARGRRREDGESSDRLTLY